MTHPSKSWQTRHMHKTCFPGLNPVSPGKWFRCLHSGVARGFLSLFMPPKHWKRKTLNINKSVLRTFYDEAFLPWLMWDLRPRETDMFLQGSFWIVALTLPFFFFVSSQYLNERDRESCLSKQVSSLEKTVAFQEKVTINKIKMLSPDFCCVLCCFHKHFCPTYYVRIINITWWNSPKWENDSSPKQHRREERTTSSSRSCLIWRWLWQRGRTSTKP